MPPAGEFGEEKKAMRRLPSEGSEAGLYHMVLAARAPQASS